ncbi:MAG: acyltransferase, partial [Cyanobacteria bacterium J06598_1]
MLRGWAIVWVVAYHLMGNTRGYLVWDEAIATLSKGGTKNIVETGLEILISAGAAGVNVFLVISGFGLTASWWKRYGSQGIEKIPLAEFWRKRVFRIFPSFWVAMALSVLLYFLNSSWAPFGQTIWQQELWSPVFALLATISTLRNFIPDYYYFLNGAWWYVGLCLQLYLIFPYLVRLGCRWGWAKLLTASLLFSLAYRAVFLLSPVDDAWRLIALAFFPARLFEFVFGTYLAMMFLQPGSPATQRIPLNFWLNNLLFKPQFLPVNFCLFSIGLCLKWSAYPALNIFAEAFIAVGLFCGLISLSRVHLTFAVSKSTQGLFGVASAMLKIL